MPQATRIYTWKILWEDELMPVAAFATVDRILNMWSRRWAWLLSATVGLEGESCLSFSVTVRGNDQWRVHRRAVKVASATAAALRMPYRELGIPVPAKTPRRPRWDRVPVSVPPVEWRRGQQDAGDQKQGREHRDDAPPDDEVGQEKTTHPRHEQGTHHHHDAKPNDSGETHGLLRLLPRVYDHEEE